MTSDTLARAIVMAVTLLNLILTTTGHAPLDLDENTIYVAVTSIWTVVWAIWCFWKNNDFTPEAIRGSDYMRELKARRGVER